MAPNKGPEALRPKYTAYVVDTNFLVAHLETLSLITSQRWPVVDPISGNITLTPLERVHGLIVCCLLPVIAELCGLAKDAGLVGYSARPSLITINKSISE